jgi:phosphate transport system substrate-binding protein
MKNLLFFFFISIALSACIENTEKAYDDTPTSGTVAIGVDETLYPVIKQEAFLFEQLYTRTKLIMRYKPEVGVLKDLLGDSIRMAVMARELTQEEKDFFAQKSLNPRITPLAYDAVVFLLHPSNKATKLTYNQVLQIIKGEITDWKQLGGTAGKINLVFDNANSSTVTYLMKTAGVQALPPNSFSAKINQAVVQHTSENPSSLGIIGLSWICDYDDKKVKGFLDKVNMAAIEPRDTLKGNFYTPSQETTGLKTYPFTRLVNIVNIETKSGLATGFSAFMASDRGQRVILKAGMSPYEMPIRLLYLHSKQMDIQNK